MNIDDRTNINLIGTVSVSHNTTKEEQIVNAHKLVDSCLPEGEGKQGVLLVAGAEDLVMVSLNADQGKLYMMLVAAKKMLENVIQGEIEKHMMDKKDIN